MVIDYRDIKDTKTNRTYNILIRWYLYAIKLNDERIANLEKGDWQHA